MPVAMKGKKTTAQANKGTVKATNVVSHDFETNDGMVVKKEKKHTTTIKPKGVSVASRNQQKQMKELCE
jgi:hypothetical protein